MTQRRCINCGEEIRPEPYDAATAKVDFAANAAAWIGGYCSRWCMVATAIAKVKSGAAWWQRPPERPDEG